MATTADTNASVSDQRPPAETALPFASAEMPAAAATGAPPAETDKTWTERFDAWFFADLKSLLSPL